VRVVFVNEGYWPSEVATAQLLTDLAQDLARRGHDVTVWCHASKGVAQAKAEHEGVRIERLAGLSERVFVNVRPFRYAMFLLSCAVRALFASPPDVIVTLTTPPMLDVVGWLATIRGARWITWQMDLYPEVLEAAALLRRDGLLARMWKAIRSQFWRRSERVVTLAPAMAERVQASARHARIEVISNWTDDRAIRPMPIDGHPFRRDHGLTNDDLLLMYSGNIGWLHPMTSLVEALTRVGHEPGIHCWFVGGGRRRGEVFEAYKRHQWPGVKFLPAQPRERLNWTLTAADVHAITLFDAAQDTVAPSKLYGVLAAGRPIVMIGAPGGEVARVIQEAQCGWVLPEKDSGGALADLLLAWRDDRAELMRHGAHGRRWLDDNASQRLRLERWRSIITSPSRSNSSAP